MHLTDVVSAGEHCNIMTDSTDSHNDTWSLDQSLITDDE